MATGKHAQGPATLRDIARLAGVSVNTASLAVRQSPRLSEATRRRVQQLARRLQYVPNRAARNLASSRSGLLGIYTRALHDAVRTRLVNCLFAELHATDYRPLLGLGEGHDGPWHTSPWIRTFLELQVEAIVVVVEGVNRLPHWPGPIPTILVGCQPRESLRCDYLGLDRREGARLAVDHLLARGHRRVTIASLGSNLFADACLERLRGAGAQASLLPLQMPLAASGVEELAENVLCAPNRPTAIVFGDSPLAARFLHALAGRGLRVPQDMAVISYDYLPWADLLPVPLTTVEQPIEEMAVEAARMIKTRLASPDAPRMQIVMPHRLVVRRSA